MRACHHLPAEDAHCVHGPRPLWERDDPQELAIFLAVVNTTG